MEFSTTVLARITEKEAKELAKIINDKLKNTLHKPHYVGFEEALVNAITDYEFEQEVEVSYDPEPDDWR